MTAPEIEALLVAAAVDARDRAYCPYSRFAVGAAVLADDGRLFTGSNVENASYGLTICAERSAVFAAIGAGVRHLDGIAIVSGASPPSAPCGACRQVLREFAPMAASLAVVLADPAGNVTTRTTLAALLPQSFGPDDLARR